MIVINAKLRQKEEKGTAASRRFRKAGLFPATVYGGSLPPVSIVLDHDVVKNLEANPAFYNEILTLEVGEEKTKVKIQAIQRHPFKPKLTHMDFIRANEV
ncbi:50S ribosomal protein L25 [Candidatus Williamhamiltonella defendens]|uniref:Large ribosomal subunit protein bL25 n=2 Tax=Candidatus Williamhamiltonella defendens TaxID=138072 RepID=A0A2D3T5X1_9ENTR|nr:50S ribosomal protein L25 [Candidatus Hamiltonella defensa]ACQ67220.1 50S ribosomal subunit protein L25 [Candidatus Hamiltonella defensa 5AT (Acyrthosiphon pisum)]ATW21977.1 50S ribosomal protein L25 [Candidatus Hamiltonella defensa]ATW29232.1 50S ribosomal protein L25 [Candidatus Hamiltonella defensa]ATW31212.1 50S ribosomal protein L25 [Candidatus Hamiltonella defensa]ATW34603.1 50S ribosomal protein L25 [Candidatus Hamiltonella defensa]